MEETKKDILLTPVEEPVQSVPTPDKRIKLSPTSILAYRSCPRQFYYRYVLRLPTKLNIHLIKGNVVHSVFENLFKAKSYYKKNLEEEGTRLLEHHWSKKAGDLSTLDMTPEEIEIHHKDGLNMVASYIRKLRLDMELLMEVGKAKSDSHAYMLIRPQLKELWLEDPELLLRGYVDRIHIDWDGQVIIGDYKTSSRFGIGIKEDYELQCGLYALLYKRVKNINADWTSIIFLRYGTEVLTRVTPSTIKYALDAVKEVRDVVDTTLEKDDYPLRESKLCKWCDFYDRCSGLRETEDKIRQDKALAEFNAQKKDKQAQPEITGQVKG